MVPEKCSAFYPNGSRCTQPILSHSKWCAQHNSERVHLYLGYKSHHQALDALSDSQNIETDLRKIDFTSSFELLKKWSEGLSEKWRLLNRCILARTHFMERFFADDMDFGHKQYADYLKSERAKIEEALTHVENRAHQINLARQNALWVIEEIETRRVAPRDECSKPEEEAKPPSPKTKKVKLDECTEDPIEAALRHKSQALRIVIKREIATLMAPAASIHYTERLDFVYAILRRCILHDPSLHLAAQKYSSVPDFLACPDLSVLQLEAISKFLEWAGPADVRDAINDILIEEPELSTLNSVTLLGGKVYRHPPKPEPWPIRVWGHCVAIRNCFGCLRTMCLTTDDVIGLTKFCAVQNPYLGNVQRTFDTDCRKDYYMHTIIFRMCGFIISDYVGDPRRKIEKTNSLWRKNVALWEETSEEYCLCASLSINDPLSDVFVDLLMRSPYFTHIVRKGPDRPIVRSPEGVYGIRNRRAGTRAGLQKAPWSERSTYEDSVLEEARPKRRKLENGDFLCIDDGYLVAIIDATEAASFEVFLDRVRQLWEEAHGCESEDELLSAVTDQHFELRKNGKVLEYLESEIGTAYRSLWAEALPATKN